jgi:ABC-type Fe3+-hydroxamate transport system substrate-binding protein
MITINDDLNNTISFEKHPQRIVSLVPSLTKTIADLGGSEKLTAVTNFCKYPENVVNILQKIGGPKNVKINEITKIEPDVIFSVKEENNREQIEMLQKRFKVIVFDISTIEDALRMIKTVSVVLGKEEKGTEFVNLINNKLFVLEKKHVKLPSKVLYLIWKNPWMAAGKQTFISSMLDVVGFKNVVEGRYPVVESVDFLNAEIILLSSEPYNFSDKDKVALLKEYPRSRIFIVDGEMFSWYGTMMTQALNYIVKLHENILLL